MSKYPVQFEIEFLPNPYGGLFVALEGIDGSGKTTQAERVVEALKKKGKKVIYTKEPTDEPTGKLIRKILRGKTTVPAVSLQYLFCSDRTVHIEQIKKFLQEDYVVITDRYFWSSVAYGIADMNNTSDYFLTAFSILSFYHRFPVPDISIYLDVKEQIAMERIEKSEKHKDIYDKHDKLLAITKGYAFLLKKFPDKFTIVDGEKPIKKITEEIVAKIIDS